MTNWQKESNFFLGIRLDRPEAVIVDRASRELRDLYNMTDLGSAEVFHPFAEGMDLPEYHRKGVLTYDTSEEEPVFFQDFQERTLEKDEEEAVSEQIPDDLGERDVTIGVDVYNEFDVAIPSNSYINSTDFSEYDEILNDEYRLNPYTSQK